MVTVVRLITHRSGLGVLIDEKEENANDERDNSNGDDSMTI
jgi:hypothetical protein